jgi:hypothetical protein
MIFIPGIDNKVPAFTLGGVVITSDLGSSLNEQLEDAVRIAARLGKSGSLRDLDLYGSSVKGIHFELVPKSIASGKNGFGVAFDGLNLTAGKSLGTSYYLDFATEEKGSQGGIDTIYISETAARKYGLFIRTVVHEILHESQGIEKAARKGAELIFSGLDRASEP